MPDQERITFTDDEAAFLRHVRFGELPPRPHPDELGELLETDPRRDGQPGTIPFSHLSGY